MSNTMRMSIPQWDAYAEAKNSGDTVLAEMIMDLGYQPEFNMKMLDSQIKEATEEVTEFDSEDILDAVAAGMENKEIYKKFGITAQKLAVLKKGAK